MDGPAGRLSIRHHGPDDGRPVLVLHPHPKYGGTKGTRLIYRLCQALADAGFHATRFDFRGAGDSDGAFDGGRGETDDSLFVWDHLAAKHGQPPIVIGFSFGGGVAVRVAGKRPVPALLCIAPPPHVRDSDLDPVREAGFVEAPAFVVVGSDDELVAPGDAQAVAEALGATFVELEGADHFLTPTHHDRCIETVLAGLQGLL
ncbi:MAG: alpha/beta hydrolase [Thermoplasmatota archaeon]